MADTILRAMAADDQIRILVASTRNICEYAKNNHDLTPATTVALGRLLTAGSMMGAMMKNDDELLTLQIKGDGPIGSMTVTANTKAEVKGFVAHPEATSNDPLKTQSVIGEGMLRIIKDIGLKEPYIGTTPLITGEIAEDLTYYYAFSEQIPTSMALGVTINSENEVQAAGGFILQLLPGCDKALIDTMEQRLSQSEPITDLLDKGYNLKEIADIIFGDIDIKVMDEIPTFFECDCTKEKVIKALITVGKKELKEMVDDGEPIEIKCDFCSKKYVFTPEELSILLQRMQQIKRKRPPQNASSTES